MSDEIETAVREIVDGLFGKGASPKSREKAENWTCVRLTRLLRSHNPLDAKLAELADVADCDYSLQLFSCGHGRLFRAGVGEWERDWTSGGTAAAIAAIDAELAKRKAQPDAPHAAAEPYPHWYEHNVLASKIVFSERDGHWERFLPTPDAAKWVCEEEGDGTEASFLARGWHRCPPPAWAEQPPAESNSEMLDRLRAKEEPHLTPKQLEAVNDCLEAHTIPRYERMVEALSERPPETKEKRPVKDITDQLREYAEMVEQTKPELSALLEEAKDKILYLRKLLDGGVGRIARERQRQATQEGYKDDHDAGHERGELATAAFLYARVAAEQAENAFTHGYDPDHLTAPHKEPAALWPWAPTDWKPKGQVRNLERAGALIAAQLDRIAATAKAEPPETPQPVGESKAVKEWYDAAIQACKNEHGEIDWCTLIAKTNGWGPLEIGEEMTVKMCGKVYAIRRKKKSTAEDIDAEPSDELAAAKADAALWKGTCMEEIRRRKQAESEFAKSVKVCLDYEEDKETGDVRIVQKEPEQPPAKAEHPCPYCTEPMIHGQGCWWCVNPQCNYGGPHGIKHAVMGEQQQRIAALEAELAAAKSRIAELEQPPAKLEQAVDLRPSSYADDAAVPAALAAGVLATAADWKAKCEKAESDLAAAKARIQDLSDANADASEREERLEGELAAARAERDASRRAVECSRECRRQAEAANAELRTQIAELESAECRVHALNAVRAAENDRDQLRAKLERICGGAKWCGWVSQGIGVNVFLWHLPNCDGRINESLSDLAAVEAK